MGGKFLSIERSEQRLSADRLPHTKGTRVFHSQVVRLHHTHVTLYLWLHVHLKPWHSTKLCICWCITRQSIVRVVSYELLFTNLKGSYLAVQCAPVPNLLVGTAHRCMPTHHLYRLVCRVFAIRDRLKNTLKPMK